MILRICYSNAFIAHGLPCKRETLLDFSSSHLLLDSEFQAQQPQSRVIMKMFTFVPMVAFATLAIAAPTTVVARADTCGQWDSIATGSYTVYNNLWGESSATSGSQCFGVDSVRGDAVSWHTT